MMTMNVNSKIEIKTRQSQNGALAQNALTETLKVSEDLAWIS